jgi:hypothetical protein
MKPPSGGFLLSPEINVVDRDLVSLPATAAMRRHDHCRAG